ncbi:MAG: FAD:protein FMN transferase [Akkermansiaceae bacterium]|nr:FAD:protein FMN transferase [Akkermansiaceae bacterium]
MTEPVPAARLFTHEAMNTTFFLRICEPDATTANGMARECCDQIDLLESRLSRFFDGSDVSRINRMRAGETLYLSESCHQCLLVALQGNSLTGGLFDITLGRPIAHLKSRQDGAEPEIVGQLIIHPDTPAITCESPGREIDLGGIGKGFALDLLRQLLVDWGAEGGLLAAGASSLIAFGSAAWPIDLTGDCATQRITLMNAALSASGSGIQGSHIVHPRGENAMPVNPSRRVWVKSPTAAMAEIWSTALMLLDPKDVPAFIAGDDSIDAVYLDDGEHVQRVISC